MWGGTVEGCYESRWIRDDMVLTYDEWDRDYNNGEDDYCDTIYPRPPILQTKFLGHYFCGVTTADSFTRAVRVDPITKLCP